MRRSSPPRGELGMLSASMVDARADYQAAKSSAYRRRRTGLNPQGSGADYHYRSEADYLRLIEQWRDFDRNDLVAGSLVDTACTAWLRSGFTPDPQTGDPALDIELWERWQEWGSDPELCDDAGEHTWPELERLTARALLGDGDCLHLPLVGGRLQMVEAHRLRTPHRTRRHVVNGVLLDPASRRRLAYFLCPDDVDPLAPSPKLADMRQIASRDAEGFRQVFHVYRPKRCTQTRGVTSFAPLFDALGMFEDIQFARLVQQQVVSCFGVFRQTPLGAGALGPPPQSGERTEETRADGSTRVIEGIAPGMDIRGRPGETLQAFSPNVPGTGFFEQTRLILQLVGVNLGLPLVLVMLDAKETNYSGWRGAIESAREGFRINQQRLIERFHRPVYLWKLRDWAAEDAALGRRAAQLGKQYFAHKWQTPEWPYIDPTKDVAADLTQLRNGLNSPRRIQAGHGRDHQEIAAETIEDNAYAIRAAVSAAKKLSAEVGETIHWRELLFLPTPDGVQVALQPAVEPGERSDVGSSSDDDAPE